MRGALDCVSAKISPTESTEVFTVHSYTESAPDLSDKRKDVESQSNSDRSRCKRYCWRLIIDLPLLVTLIAVLVLFEIGKIPSMKYGFYCNDPALSHPFRGDTVTTTILVAGVMLMPIVVFFLTELAMSKGEGALWSSTASSFRLYRKYTFGLLINFTISQLLKGLAGEPRPVFFDMCKPDAALTCKENEFVSTFECTSSFSRMDQIDSHRSFPSGHAALSVFCSIYLAWYLQVRAFSWSNRSVLIVPLIQLGVLSFAIISTVTRITDHRHHWWDVLAGSVIAVVTVVYAILFVSNNFSTFRLREEDATTTEEELQKTKTILFQQMS